MGSTARTEPAAGTNPRHGKYQSLDAMRCAKLTVDFHGFHGSNGLPMLVPDYASMQLNLDRDPILSTVGAQWQKDSILDSGSRSTVERCSKYP